MNDIFVKHDSGSNDTSSFTVNPSRDFLHDPINDRNILHQNRVDPSVVTVLTNLFDEERATSFTSYLRKWTCCTYFQKISTALTPHIL